VNGIHVLFTIVIQAMIQFGHNELISMDATFDTNNVKYHLFTSITFDFHHTRVPVVWVITSQQTCENLVN
jgi:hypothetical protein